MKTIDEITKSRSLLVLDHCFWGMLAMRLKMQENPNCETAATDGELMMYNPEFIDSLSTPELIGVLAHEVMHCAMGDIWRLGERDSYIWNMAADYVNNIELNKAGFTLPKGCLLDQKYAGKSKEEVYNILYKELGGKGKGKDGKGSGNGKDGQDLRDPGKCGGMFKPSDAKQAKEGQMEWKKAVAQAVALAAGDIPGELRKMILDEVLDPPLPWHVLLRDFIERTAKNDYNWVRPNRRYLPQGIILPSLISDELPMVCIGDDTSGSTSGFETAFANEVSGILASYQTTTLVIHADCKVHNVEEYRTEDLPIKLDPRGGGGTSFEPVFDYIEKEGITPACLIYLTDLEGRFPSQEPDYPVIWVSVTKDKKAPFGETVYLDAVRKY